MKIHQLLMASTLFFYGGNLTLEASETELFTSDVEVGDAKKTVPRLKRTCNFSANNPVDRILFGEGENFIINAFKCAGSNFWGKGPEGHKEIKKDLYTLLLQYQGQ